MSLKYNDETVVTTLRNRVKELENAIKSVVTLKEDDVCWMDIYAKLGHLVGVEFKPQQLSRERMLKRCEVYVDAVRADKPDSYTADAATELLRQHPRHWSESSEYILDANNQVVPSRLIVETINKLEV